MLESPKKPCLHPPSPAAPLYPKSSVCLATPLQTGMLNSFSLPEAPRFLPELEGQSKALGEEKVNGGL